MTGESTNPTAPADEADRREAVQELAEHLTRLGIPTSTDEAQVVANIAHWLRDIVKIDGLGTAATRELASGSPLPQACLATLAKAIVTDHGSADARALATLHAVVAVIAGLTQAPAKRAKLKHAKG